MVFNHLLQYPRILQQKLYKSNVQVLNPAPPCQDPPLSCQRQARHRNPVKVTDSAGAAPKRCGLAQKNAQRKPGVDRLSKLPDSVLVHILSFVPLPDAIKTEVLSKRWKSLWTYLPSLLFRQIEYEDDDLEDDILEDRDFVGFVDRTLLLSNCSNVKRLRFDLEYKPSFASNVDLWVRFAAAKETEELSLEFNKYRSDMDKNRRYELRQHLFSNSLFRGLHFRCCRLNPRRKVDWKSLKKLSIGEAKVSNALLEKILSGSPVLEMLELYGYEGFSRLHLNTASLKKLILRSYNGPSPRSERGNEEHPDGLVILAPHLQSLEICGHLPRNCQLINVSSLVDAKLACSFKGDNSEEDCIRIRNELAGLLLSFAHVKSLAVGTWAMQELSSMVAKGLSCPLLNGTSMTLEARLDDRVFPWIATMLGLSPQLETLVMTRSSPEFYSGGKLSSYELQHYWTAQMRIFNCLHLHLKKVVFAHSSWIRYKSNFFSFVQFLLKNAKVLQKVIIHTSMPDDAMPKQFYAAANKLLTFPRSSPDAVVMFCK